MFVLDTNVVSELRPGKPKASRVVHAWAATVPQSRFYLSAITVLEQELAVLQLERRTPPEGSNLRAWWNATLQVFADRVLPLDAKAAQLCAAMSSPNPKALRDSMLAATAMAHGFAVVTRNVRDYQAIAGLTIINPWDYTSGERS